MGSAASSFSMRFDAPKVSWCLVNIYAPNTHHDRLVVWEDVRTKILVTHDDVWMVAGDFNTPIFPSRKLGGLVDYFDNGLNLANFMNMTNLLDIDLPSKIFTCWQ